MLGDAMSVEQVIVAAPVAALLVLGVFFLGATGHLLEGGMALVAVNPKR